VNQLFLQYSYLQMLDFMTTLAFLLNGVGEANPVVRFALQYSPNPVGGLLVVKLVALALGVYCWRAGRQRLLGRINFLFAALVAWNLLALIANLLPTHAA
jgi:fumarate reductase subunit C